MIKRIINNLSIIVLVLLSSLAYATPGFLFKISESGSFAAADVILCLNGLGPSSCQNYHVSSRSLAISTTTNHYYPTAGIKILTPGYQARGCMPYPNGFCLFAVNSQIPTTIILNANLPATPTVGGRISGLVGSVSLQNNGGDTLTQNTDGSFTFAMPITEGSTYAVTVSSQPATQTCTVSNGSGTVGSTNVTNVQVNCSANAYSIGGTISGLVGSVSLQNNGGDTLTQNTNGSFTFATPVAEGSTYAVTVSSQPATQTCTVSNGSGTVGSSNVTNVQVSCSTNAHSIGGTISGLVGSVSLQNNGGDTLTQNTNGSFTFATPVAEGSTYAVTVSSQPATQTCTVSNGSGTMGSSNVTNVDVSCANNTTTLSVNSTGIIPVNSSSGIITVTNTGINTAFNVSVNLPSAWIGVTQDASACTIITPGNGCNILLTSTTPYIAQGNILVSGDNISNSPTIALAFSVQGNLVWEITNATTVQVIDNSNLAAAVWGGFGTAIGPGAQSLTDGASNTLNIVNQLGTGSSYAAELCNQSTNGGASTGTWYLPAICQMGGSGQGAGCATGLANIDTNLVQFGFGSLSGLFWSSTE